MRPVVLPILFAAAPLTAAEPVVTDADLAMANQTFGELRRDLSVDANPLRSGGTTFTGNRVTYNTNYKSWNRPPFDFHGCDNTVIRDNKVENLPAGRTWPE